MISALVGILIGPFPACLYPVGAQPSSEVASLIDQLCNGSTEARRAAALAFGKIGPAATDAVPQLIAPLKDPDTGVRPYAALASTSLGLSLRLWRQFAKPAVLHLVELLKDPDNEVRQAAAYVLGRIGPEAKAAIPQLMTFLKDPNVRRASADALGWIGPEAKAAVPHLVELLKDPAENVQRAAAGAPKEIESAANDMV